MMNDQLKWISKNKHVQEIMHGKLGLHSLMYIVSILGSIWALTSKAQGQWALPPDVRYVGGVLVLIISILLLTMEVMNTLIPKKAIQYGNETTKKMSPEDCKCGKNESS